MTRREKKLVEDMVLHLQAIVGTLMGLHAGTMSADLKWQLNGFMTRIEQDRIKLLGPDNEKA